MVKSIISRMFIILTYINRYIPKNENRIIIYSNLGFRDNVKALYLYLTLNNYNKKYQIICSVNDYKKYKNCNFRNVKFVSNYTGIIYFLFSKFFFYSFGKYPIKPAKKQVVINLWHGMPLKKIGNMEAGNKGKKYNYFNYVISTSELFVDIMEQSFQCSENQVIVIGQPRNDLLKSQKDVKKILEINKYEKIVVWMPTFRYSSRLKANNTCQHDMIYGFPLLKTHNDIININKTFLEMNSVLIVKPHPMQDVSVTIKKLSNIIFVDDNYLLNKKIELYELIKECDALITDYSSVFFDYLLLNRPMGFIIDDIEEYIKNRGFVFENPLNMMPGVHITNIKEFNDFCKAVFMNEDSYAKDRERVNHLVNKYRDFESSKRLLDFCGITNGEER